MTFHGQAVYTEAPSAISGLQLDEAGVPEIPPGFSYTDITEIQEFSNLRMRWWYFEGGIRTLVRQNWAFEYALTYSDFNDYQRYLFVDTTGSKLGMLLRINWLF